MGPQPSQSPNGGRGGSPVRTNRCCRVPLDALEERTAFKHIVHACSESKGRVALVCWDIGIGISELGGRSWEIGAGKSELGDRSWDIG
eukprot:3527805-Alexandrium_andersonii.AAC.1